MLRIIITTIALTICTFSYAKRSEPSIIHFDVSENKVMFNQNISDTRSIASVTKLMTAMVALDYSTDMNKQLNLVRKVKSSLPPKSYTRGELFEAMLIRSDNAAAETLASDYPGGRDAFLKAMNKKTCDLGMNSTYFKDPTGLNMGNISTANEVVNMVIAASNYPTIKNISIRKQTLIETKFKKKIRKIVLYNTNRRVLFEFDNVIVSKTGFTNPAGYCVAIMVEQNGRKHVIVILGAKNSKERVDTVKEIMYNNIIDGEHH